MPPRKFSRHVFTIGFKDSNDRLILTDRVRYPYRVFQDNREHPVQQGDTLQNLASRYFKPLQRPSGLWWVIADFQPTPIHDPTLLLEPSRIMIIPSVRTVLEEIFSATRRQEAI